MAKKNFALELNNLMSKNNSLDSPGRPQKKPKPKGGKAIPIDAIKALSTKKSKTKVPKV